jgi:hypothetical protein
MVLLDTGETFNIDSDDSYTTHIASKELANGYGYTTAGELMTTAAVSVDDANDRADATWDDVVWTASGGSIGPTPRAVLYDDTHASKQTMGDVAFSGEQTATDGGTFTVSSPTVRIA